MKVHYDTADSNNPCDYTTIIGGIEDTIDAVIIISIVIVVITVIVNLIALGISFEKNNNS